MIGAVSNRRSRIAVGSLIVISALLQYRYFHQTQITGMIRTSGQDSPSRELKAPFGKIIRTPKFFDDLESQEKAAFENGDCVTPPTVHYTIPGVSDSVVATLMAAADFHVGSQAEQPEVRQLGPGANYVVWDGVSGAGNAPEWMMHNGRASAWNNNEYLESEEINLVAPIRWEFEKPGIVMEGDYVGFHNWINGNYPHLLMDHLSMVAWLDQEVVSEDTKFIFVDMPITKHVMSKLDPEFFENRLVWIKPGELFHVTGTLTVAMPKKWPQEGFMGNLLQWLRRIHPEPVIKDKYIFYSRTSKEVYHGRKMNVEFEQSVIEIVRHKMKQQLGISGDELIIFNGLNEDGSQIPFDEQYDLFSRAKTIIGPHGGGMANMVWASVPRVESCSERVQVLEFMGSASFYGTFYGLPIDHHIIPFTARTSDQNQELFIDLRDLKDALDAMWHRDSQIVEE